MRKRMTLLALTLALAAAFSGCGSNPAPAEQTTAATTAETTAITTTDSNDVTLNDDEIPYWDGMDFGPNVSYDEETTLLADPGEYQTPAEAARDTFERVRDNKYIPEYSDDTEYTMVFLGLEECGGEECYVYRLEIDEPTGTLGAAYAYAYQSKNIYIKVDDGEFVFILGGDPNQLYNEDLGN